MNKYILILLISILPNISYAETMKSLDEWQALEKQKLIKSEDNKNAVNIKKN